jgi:hypothetical protein
MHPHQPNSPCPEVCFVFCLVCNIKNSCQSELQGFDPKFDCLSAGFQALSLGIGKTFPRLATRTIIFFCVQNKMSCAAELDRSAGALEGPAWQTCATAGAHFLAKQDL